MKTVMRMMSVMLAAAMLAFVLSACAGVPSGTYINGEVADKQYDSYTQYKFSGSKFEYGTYVMGEKVEGLSKEGKYKLVGNEITFTWEDKDGEEQTETKSFSENEDGFITIDTVTYKKQ